MSWTLSGILNIYVGIPIPESYGLLKHVMFPKSVSLVISPINTSLSSAIIEIFKYSQVILLTNTYNGNSKLISGG